MAHAANTICILGPTASGKSALALQLARRLPPGRAEIVSADSMQIYRGMDIGTAKATPAERQEVVHHLVDIADPHHGSYTLADWLDDAREAIAGIHARGGVALVVGGTNLYLKALLEGMFEGPPINATLRAELEALPTEMLRRELEQTDPMAAARIHANDRRRTLRAVEVHRQTGTPISELQAQWKARPNALPEGWWVVGWEWTAEALNRRINERVYAMMDAGLLREVIALAGAGPLARQAIEAVGYSECLRHLAGELTLDAAVEEIKVRSRRYGKQQRTWLRRFRAIPGSLWFDGASIHPEQAAELVLAKIFPNRPEAPRRAPSAP
jgi:tRNA dimethylallyltransferase